MILANAIVVFAVVVLWLRFNAPPGESAAFFAYDFLNYYLPMTELVAGRLKAGELPLWNPHSCSGIPLLATLQVGVFYPGTWLSVLAPAAVALPVRMFLETALAGCFSALWFRSLGTGALASATGGVLFVFSCVLGEAFWPASLSSVLWLPALLLCVEKIVSGSGWRWWIALVLATCLQFLAGFPQYLVYTHYLLAPYALLRLASVRRRSELGARKIGARAARLALAVGIGAGLSGAQLLPTLELVENSHRSESLDRDAVHHFGVGKRTTFGDVLANTIDPSPKLISSGYGSGAGYLGIPALVFAVLGLVAGARSALTWFWVAVAGFAFLLSGGYQEWSAPLYELFAQLPTGSTFRVPQRLRLLCFVAVIALSVSGFDHFFRGFGELRGRRRFLAITAATAAGVIVCAAGPLAAAARAAATLTLLFVVARFRGRPRVVAVCSGLMLLLVIADLRQATGPGFVAFRSVPVGWSQNLHASGHAFVSGERFAELRREAGTARLAFPNLMPPLGIAPLGGAYRVSCLEPLVPSQWTALEGVLTKRRNTVVTLFGLPQRSASRFYDLAGVHTVVSAEQSGRAMTSSQRAPASGEDGGPAEGPAPGWNLAVRANDDALPRAYVVTNWRVVSQIEAWRTIARGGVDFQRLVLLDRSPGMAPGALSQRRAAEIVSYAPERVEIEAESEEGGVLVLSDSYYPGWTAQVDGAPSPILRANGLYRAVVIPAGRHRVVFEYRPSSFRHGAWLSAASALVLVALPLADVARRRAARS